MNLSLYIEEVHYFNGGYENENLFYFSPQFHSQYQQPFKDEPLINDYKIDIMKNRNIPNSFTEIETKENSKKFEEELVQNEKELYGHETQFNFINNVNRNNIEKTKVNIKQKEEKKKRGKKPFKDNHRKIDHNKYSDDNLRRKCKHLVIKNALKFINYKILIFYNGKIGKGIFKKELQTLNQSQKKNSTVNFNKIFLNKTLGEIFSENISGKFTIFPPHHNRLLIEKLMNEEDEEKRIFFNKLFNLTFIQCLKHFRGEDKIDILDGLKCFEDIKNEIIECYEDDGLDYYYNLYYYLNNFEEIINNKKSRKSRK